MHVTLTDPQNEDGEKTDVGSSVSFSKSLVQYDFICAQNKLELFSPFICFRSGVLGRLIQLMFYYFHQIQSIRLVMQPKC